MTPRTLFEKVWEPHVVRQLTDDVALLYVDLHRIHEVTSPQAFTGLKRAGRAVRRPERTLATVDHSIPTGDRSRPIADPVAARQVDALGANAREFGIELFDLASPGQGIVHVIGPELGATQPGMVIVCGDSHTATHGAFGAFALGIGTSEVEHVLATQCVALPRPHTLAARITGARRSGVSAKDLILALIGRIGSAPTPNAPPRSGRWSTWGSNPVCRSRGFRSIACSWDRVRTRGSRTCAPRPPSCAAGMSHHECGRWSCPARSV